MGKSDWNSNQYMKFGKERTQPSLDLINRIRDLEPSNILDIGCGPGNSTFALYENFPNAGLRVLIPLKICWEKQGKSTLIWTLKSVMYLMI